MKILATCTNCINEKGFNNVDVGQIQPNSQGLYEYTCSYGHKNILITQEFDFEILFEIACYAILDGYNREAVTTFKSSLESYYIFFIKIVSLREEISTDTLEKILKKELYTSERQYGAFILLWVMIFKEKPIAFKEADFRNKVVHQGYIPTELEAKKFGQNVLKLIYQMNIKLRQEFPSELQKMIMNNIVDRAKNLNHTQPRSYSEQGTLLHSMVFSDDIACPDINDLLNRIKRKTNR